jgi:hypothetical protein
MPELDANINISVDNAPCPRGPLPPVDAHGLVKIVSRRPIMDFPFQRDRAFDIAFPVTAGCDLPAM